MQLTGDLRCGIIVLEVENAILSHGTDGGSYTMYMVLYHGRLLPENGYGRDGDSDRHSRHTEGGNTMTTAIKPIHSMADIVIGLFSSEALEDMEPT